MRTRIILSLATILLMTSTATGQLSRNLTVEEMRTEQRVALIIGNGDYPDSPLRNPVSDAESMAAALTACGFKITKKFNCGAQEMDEAMRDFGREILYGGVGLLYYAGHGVQVGGQNYLRRISRRRDCLSGNGLTAQVPKSTRPRRKEKCPSRSVSTVQLVVR